MEKKTLGQVRLFSRYKTRSTWIVRKLPLFIRSSDLRFGLMGREVVAVHQGHPESAVATQLSISSCVVIA